MDDHSPRGLLRHFDNIEDPRIDRTKHHRLDDMLAIAILVMVARYSAAYGQAFPLFLLRENHVSPSKMACRISCALRDEGD